MKNVNQAEYNLAAYLFDSIAEISCDDEGVSRPAYSDKETEVLDWLANWARGEGLHVEADAGRNLLFCLPRDRKAEHFVVVGSHVDSVPRGGNFDGLAGVVAGLLCLIRARDASRPLPRPLRALAMRGEESAWFGSCYNASKCLTGTITGDDLDACHAGDGRTLEAHMADQGIDTARLRRGEPLADLSTILEYIELHIEQGPLLIEKDLPAAIVSGIRGNIRHRRVRCTGEPGHSGAVPRSFRRDPVLAMVELLSRLDESWKAILQEGGDLVLTAGVVTTDPERHAMSRIPDMVDFSLDIRSQNAEMLDQMREVVTQEMHVVEAERGVSFAPGPEMRVEPAWMDSRIVEGLSVAMKDQGMQPLVMSSGGGHDAAVFANANVPSGMVFVRNRGGSHNPGENMELEDFLVAVSMIYGYIKN